MEKIKKHLIVKILVVFFVLLLVVSIGYFVLFQNAIADMSPLNTQEVIPGIYAIKTNFAGLAVNSYLIEVNNSKQYIAIDAGNRASQTRDELHSLGISSEDVIALLLTHTHSDHTAALSLFDKAAVYTGDNTKYSKTSATIMDGETIEISGVSIQCLFTPGHSDDSVCYLIDGQHLFVGDTLSLHDNQVGLLNSFFNKSDDMQKADIKRLSELQDVHSIFTAHYGFTDEAIFP